jgi:3'-5' exoribonuclease
MPRQTTLTGQAGTNGHQRVRDLADGQEVDGLFAVRESQLAQKKNGEDFLRMKLGDSSGSVTAVAWEDAQDLSRLARAGSIVRVSGRYSVHPQFGPQIVVRELDVAPDDELDLADFSEATEVPLERLEAELDELLGTIQNRWLGELLGGIFAKGSPTWRRFREAPAAKHYHQAYRHGLLEHTISVAQAVSAAAAAFPGIDRDVAVAGALLHDIGKTEAYEQTPLAIDLTDAGRLQGEIPLGYFLVRQAIEAIDGFPGDLAQSLVHIVLSHHGTHENGSPVLPSTREAALVHAIDNLGGKLGSFDRLERSLPDGEAWSTFDKALSGWAWFGSKAA